ncbi:rubredoxin [Hymenobacter chitinivorans]|uniref:Rubredoxin n=1 Tax=Hymenobacter chitinivorans DSM 11115 TaxID=1121954 RepID=A0A2M9BRY2_9BACT|nr:rubredoxin [Hymenobacter chitinivorans]PJJ60698.1 rubredoxin [Hymenobacter chitinivorans DSM 11115]
MTSADSSNSLIAVNLPGGIVPAGDLLAVLSAAEAAGIEQVQLGHRQQLLLTVEPARRRALLQALAAAGVLAEPDPEAHPNIVSSYVGEDVFYSAAWLREGVYKDILDLFDYRPRLKINLVDSRQTFVPFFTGHLNFIAAETSNYWHLHVRWPRTGHLYAWPHLVYSEDVPVLSAALERVLLADAGQFTADLATAGARLYAQVSATQPLGPRVVAGALALPPFMLPYYEGFNRSGQHLWLGIYRRNEQFSVAFLRDLARVCLHTRVGQLCATPWKSLIIKGIAPADRPQWDAVLCRHRINVRHAANELNWQVEDNCPAGLALKHELVRYLHEEDVRTYQLCFAIKTRPQTGLFGSIIIRTQPGRSGAEQYEILHTRDFNPNSRDFVSFRQQVRPDMLGWYLAELCHQFYAQIGAETPPETETAAPSSIESLPPATTALPRCHRCLTVYDPEYGDPSQHVAPGTRWAALPNYHCSTCEAPAAEFEFWEEPVAAGLSSVGAAP